MITAGFVCFVGGIDDRFDLPSRLKLALQIVAVVPLVLCGYSVDRVVAFSCPIELGWLGVPLTVLWLVGCINALNLLDGMDGLASIVGLSAAAMLGVIAASQGNDHVAMMATVLAASVTGFLLYNLPPASVFLGDSGSMVIGLTVGLLGIQGTLKTSATLAITAPAVVMTLPMFDIVAAVVRRKLTGRRFDAPDRLHIHHRLLDRGWNPWQVLCLFGAVCLTTGAAATAATIFRRDALAWITAITLIVLMIRLRLFGYEEFSLVKRAVVAPLRSCAAPAARLARYLGLAGLPRSRPDLPAARPDVASCPHPGQRSVACQPPPCGSCCFAMFRSGTFIKWSSVRCKTIGCGVSAGSTRPCRRTSIAAGRCRCRCPITAARFANCGRRAPSPSSTRVSFRRLRRC